MRSFESIKELLYKQVPVLLTILMTACSSGGDEAATVFALAVSVEGPGTGSVSSSPAGINCGPDCSENFLQNTIVSLTASSASGSTFDGWHGACIGRDKCTVTMDAARSVTASFVEYSVDCSADAAYEPGPGLAPAIMAAVAPATTSVIILHGKTASPLDPNLASLYTELTDAGHDVIAPYLPWRDTNWDGSMCEVMNYINLLVKQEAAKGHAVVVAGHSMGGAHALIYAITSPVDAVKAIVVMAPGHFPQLELPRLILFDPATAAGITSSINTAEDMVTNGDGDQLNTFDTLIPDLDNPLLTISSTAYDYLSYHDLDQYPDVNDVLPPIRLPVLWLAGEDDQLTTLYNMVVLAGQITSPGSGYQLVNGNHIDMVSNSGTPIQVWLTSLGL